METEKERFFREKGKRLLAIHDCVGGCGEAVEFEHKYCPRCGRDQEPWRKGYLEWRWRIHESLTRQVSLIRGFYGYLHRLRHSL